MELVSDKKDVAAGSGFGPILLPWIFLIAFAATLATASSILTDQDPFWHVAAGNWIIAHRAVPHVDVFSFSMVAHLICCRLNAAIGNAGSPFEPGTLYLTAASSHLYAENWLDALALIDWRPSDSSQYETLESMYTDEQRLLARLRALRDTGKGDSLRWWETGQ